MHNQVRLPSHAGGELKYAKKSVPVDEGTDTVLLTGLQRSTTYRVGFYKLGAPNENIPYVKLITRGKCVPTKWHPMKSD